VGAASIASARLGAHVLTEGDGSRLGLSPSGSVRTAASGMAPGATPACPPSCWSGPGWARTRGW